jgi:hypothetical protein
MAFKLRKAGTTDARPASAASDPPKFLHASGYADLAGVLGDHTLDAAQEAAITPPKGYRARSIAKCDG